MDIFYVTSYDSSGSLIYRKPENHATVALDKMRIIKQIYTIDTDL